MTSTGVPFGRLCVRQPSVSVWPPVPEQWAAWPMYTPPAPSVKTKFDVHWAPSVKVMTPGWTVADAAGAHWAEALDAPPSECGDGESGEKGLAHIGTNVARRDNPAP